MSDDRRGLATLYRLLRLLAMGTQGAALLRPLLREVLGLTGGSGGQVLLLRADRRTLWSYIGEGTSNCAGQDIPADTAPWVGAIREGKVVHWRTPPTASPVNSRAPRVTLGIPLLARGDVLGILTLQNLSGAWAKADRQPFLEALAHLAAHAVQNDAVYRDLLRQKEELATLIDVGGDITASLELDEVFRRVVRHAARLLRGRAAALLLIDEARRELRIRATYGTSASWMHTPPLDLATSLLAEVVRSASPLAILDLHAQCTDDHALLALQQGLSSLLCVPIKTNGRLLGLLSVYTRELRRFRPDEVDLLQALATQSATAIENARLYLATFEAQEQLRHSERLAALGSMSAGLAHEIRNPLHTMQLLIYAMQKDRVRSTTLTADLEVMQSEIGRLTLLVEQFLDLARPKPPQVAPQKLSEIMAETLLLVRTEAHRRGIRLHPCWPPDLPVVPVDGAQIKQVFLNVLLNAMQAMPNAGVIDVHMYTDNRSISIEVRDQGVGMSDKVKAHLFTPFFTTKSRGAGL